MRWETDELAEISTGLCLRVCCLKMQICFLCFMAPKHKSACFIWWSNKEVMTWFIAGERGDCIGLHMRHYYWIRYEHFKGVSRAVFIVDDFHLIH